jgi:hypothetical protein
VAQLHVPSGWYVEVPDDTEEDQPLSVRLSVEPPSPRDFPLCCVVFVDGHLSSRSTPPDTLAFPSPHYQRKD